MEKYVEQTIITSIYILMLLFFCGCPEESIQSSSDQLKLNVEDVTCTEAFLKISLSADDSLKIVSILRNDSTIATITFSGNDTQYVDDKLIPNKTYIYKIASEKSNAFARIITKDTTSSVWNYKIDSSGDGNSYLLDVSIINDTLAYAVGEIHIGDAFYNSMKWDGYKWTLQRFTVYYNGHSISSPIQGICTLSPSNIWLSSGIPINGDGISWTQYHLFDMGILSQSDGSVYKMWGSSQSSLIFVGNKGSIVRYNGNNWQKQESGTTKILTDIDGTSSELYVVGINVSRDAGVVLKNNGDTWTKIIDGENEGTGFVPNQLFKSQLYGSTGGVWVDNAGAVYTVGNYMYRYKLGRWDYVKSLPENHIGGQLGYRGYLEDVDGNSQNDMFIVGQKGTLRHYNGSKWTQVGLPFNYTDDLNYWYRIAVKGNLAIAVGSLNGKARIIVLNRK